MGGERIGVLGGTFDPPHVGHLVAGVEVGHALGLDRVLLVVANEPWQKVGARPVTPAPVRLELVRALVEGVSGVEASDLEIRRGGRSYTADTLEELQAGDPDGRRYLVLGADAAAGLETWERWEDLPALARLVLVDRPGMPCPPPPAAFAFERVGIPRLDVSSTDLRDRIRTGRPIDGLVPRAVATLIRQHNIYREGP